MAYADDIVLAILGKTNIKRAILTIQEWSKKYGMTFNQSKSSIIFHNKKLSMNKNFKEN